MSADIHQNGTATEIEAENSESREEPKTELQTPSGSILKISYFAHEKQIASVWLTFITLYWSAVMWIPTLINLNFGTPGFAMYCVGVVAIFAEGASILGDKYPSGATKEEPYGYNGRGRYAAIFLVICIIVDLVGLAYVCLNRTPYTQDYFRAFCHFIALVWCSLFYYNRLLKENRQMAWSVFWEEWLDIVLTIIIVLILHNSFETKYNTTHNACFRNGLCSTYWVIFMVQLTGWLLPMMIIEGWGAEKDATKVSLHLFILDLCTNVPILIVVVATRGYEVSPLIFVDVLYKAISFIRSSSYFMVYYVWLRRGAKKHVSLPSSETKG